MTELLLWILGMMLFATLLVAAAVGLAMWQLHRRNRVSPRTPTAAPITWLASPQRASRLHRRLRAAVATARFRPPGSPKRHQPAADLGDLVDDLDRYAGRIRVLSVEGEWATPLPALPTFRPTRQ